MAQVCVLETTKQLRSPPEKIFNLLKFQTQQIPKATDKIRGIQVLNGDWLSPGSVKLWKFAIGMYINNIHIHSEQKKKKNH